MRKLLSGPAAKWFLLAFSAGAFLYVLYLRRNLCFSFSPDLEGTEAFQVILLQLTNLFGSPYTDISRPPCLAVPYAPVYYELVNFFLVRLGLDVTTDIHRIYTMARQLSLLANLFNVALIYLICRQLDMRHFISVTVSLVFFLLLTFHNYAVRPDSLKLLFISVSLYFFLRAVNRERHRRFNLFASGLWVTAALLLKQDAIQVLIGLSAYMLFVNLRFRSLFHWLLLGCLTVVVIVTPYLLMNGTDLQVMMSSIAQGVGTGFEWSMYLFLIVTHYYLPFGSFIFLSGYLIYRYRKAGHRTDTSDLLITLFGCLGIMSSLFALRMGAAPLYFMEFNLIMLLLIPVLMAGARMRNLVFIMTVALLVIKLVEITRYSRANLDDTLEADFIQVEETARELGYRLADDQTVFAFEGLMNTFLVDRLAASNLGYELFTHAFYRKGIRIKIKNYKVASACSPDGIIMLNDSISESYMELFHPQLEKIHWFNDYALYGRVKPSEGRANQP